jgi:DNA-binding response OmpR family regulator
MSEFKPESRDSKPLVVVIDDDESITRMLRMVLGRYYRVETFDRAMKAVIALQGMAPDAILLDLKMPEHDGFWAFQQIRLFNKTTPIIFNSAYQDIIPPDDVLGAYRPFGFLPKNGNLKTLLEMVQAAVRSRAG